MFEQKDYYLKRIKCWEWFQISIGDIHSWDQWSLSLSPTPTVCTNSNMSFKHSQAIGLGEKVYKPRFMLHHIVFCAAHTSFFLSPCLSSSPSFSFSLAMSSEKAMPPHSSTLAWKIPWTEEPVGLQSMGSLRVGHDWANSLSFFTSLHWRRKRQSTPVFLPGESQGQGSLVGCPLCGRTESDTTEPT